jgi:hypothetical protein
MQTIDVKGLPESMAVALAETVRTLRQQLNKNGRPARLPVWSLGARGNLSREVIYDERFDRELNSRSA